MNLPTLFVFFFSSFYLPLHQCGHINMLYGVNLSRLFWYLSGAEYVSIGFKDLLCSVKLAYLYLWWYIFSWINVSVFFVEFLIIRYKHVQLCHLGYPLSHSPLVSVQLTPLILKSLNLKYHLYWSKIKSPVSIPHFLCNKISVKLKSLILKYRIFWSPCSVRWGDNVLFLQRIYWSPRNRQSSRSVTS
jgi:hypothetical protein